MTSISTRRWLRTLLPSLLMLSSLTGASSARGQGQPPSCSKLAGDKQTAARSLLAALHPYDCCDETLARCLQRKRVCRLAYRLADNVCRRVSAGQSASTIKRALSRRARSMLSRQQAKIDLADAPAVGAASAVVTVVEYACARCPYCAKITPLLHAAVSKGSLKEQVRLVFKAFPIRNHPHSASANLALMAAARLGKFWPFALYSYAHFSSFCPKKQAAWAVAAGLDRAAFEQKLADPSTRKQLIASKKEGLRNKVAVTPTFFINGRMFVGDLQVSELIDVLEEEIDRRKGRVYR